MELGQYIESSHSCSHITSGVEADDHTIVGIPSVFSIRFQNTASGAPIVFVVSSSRRFWCRVSA